MEAIPIPDKVRQIVTDLFPYLTQDGWGDRSTLEDLLLDEADQAELLAEINSEFEFINPLPPEVIHDNQTIGGLISTVVEECNKLGDE